MDYRLASHPSHKGLFKIKTNIYANPAEAIAPNGRYLIQFKISKFPKNVLWIQLQEKEHRTSLSDEELAIDSQRIKKDALYKPLLRKFRTFFRKLFDELGLSKGCHYWPAERIRKKVI